MCVGTLVIVRVSAVQISTRDRSAVQASGWPITMASSPATAASIWSATILCVNDRAFASTTMRCSEASLSMMYVLKNFIYHCASKSCLQMLAVESYCAQNFRQGNRVDDREQLCETSQHADGYWSYFCLAMELDHARLACVVLVLASAADRCEFRNGFVSNFYA